MEQNSFEQAGVKYRDKDGILYPILPSDDVKEDFDVGKYGRMWLHFLFEINRRDYNRRLLNGTLVDDAVAKNEEAYEILDLITNQELKRLSDEKKQSSLAMYQCRMAARVTAEEIFLAECLEDLNVKKSALQRFEIANTQREESEE